MEFQVRAARWIMQSTPPACRLHLWQVGGAGETKINLGADTCEVFLLTCGEAVQQNDLPTAAGEFLYAVRTDEAGTTGDEERKTEALLNGEWSSLTQTR
jgi:hypothetical protein